MSINLETMLPPRKKGGGGGRSGVGAPVPVSGPRVSLVIRGMLTYPILNPKLNFNPRGVINYSAPRSVDD